jgi:hypothetical protein
MISDEYPALLNTLIASPLEIFLLISVTVLGRSKLGEKGYCRFTIDQHLGLSAHRMGIPLTSVRSYGRRPLL